MTNNSALNAFGCLPGCYDESADVAPVDSTVVFPPRQISRSKTIIKIRLTPHASLVVSGAVIATAAASFTVSGGGSNISSVRSSCRLLVGRKDILRRPFSTSGATNPN